MRFKSVKPCLNVFVSSFAIALFAQGAPLRVAHAAIGVTPANGGSISGTKTSGGTIHYLAFNGAAPSPAVAGSAFIRFTPLNLATSLYPPIAGAYPNATQDTAGNPNMLQVSVSTNNLINLSGNQKAVITVFAYPNSGTAHQAPIAAVNGLPCPNVNCVAGNWVNGRGNNDYTIVPHYYGAIYPGSGAVVTIGLYPADICRDAYAVTGSAVNGCTGTSVTPTTGTSVVSLQLSFAIVVSDNGDPMTAPGATVIDSTPSPINFTFQSQASGFTCPDTNTLNSNYFPGDGQIFLNSSLFGLAATQTGAAPLTALYLEGVRGAGAPDTGQSFDTSGNAIHQTVGNLGSLNSPVHGFQNSTDPNNPIEYTLSFVAQDAAGIYVSPNAGCTMGPVATAQIQGFLPPGSKKCFIATAAHGSADSAPVVLLRQFRDQILLRHSFGRHFVSWYYSWSPEGAEWLTQYPFFKFPVLLLLAPLEVLAWLCLHPVYFVFLLGSLTLSGVYFVLIIRGEKKERQSE